MIGGLSLGGSGSLGPASPGRLSSRSNLRSSIPDYQFYSDVFGGELGAEGFAEALPSAVRLMRGLTTFDRVGARWDSSDAEAWLRACCAACDAFAEFGEGRVGGYAVGDFKVTNYMEKGTTGREVALEAALGELDGTGLAFGGVR